MDKLLNPPIILQNKKYTPSNKENIINYKLIREDELIGGTKQRALDYFIQDDKIEYIYAGPSQGFAQVALAYVCHLFNLKATIFLRSGKDSNQTLKAKQYKAKIIYIKNANLKFLQKKSLEYSKKKKDRFLLPFGLDDEGYTKLLAERIKISWGKKHKPKRLWHTIGSGTLLKAFKIVFPDCKFMLVKVGKKIWPDQVQGIEYELFEAPEKFFMKGEIQPPYQSVSDYDAKLWRFFIQYGKEGDYIWNVGKD